MPDSQPSHAFPARVTSAGEYAIKRLESAGPAAMQQPVSKRGDMARHGPRPATVLILGVLVLFFGGKAHAQENLAAGKTPAQLFQLDCTACHDRPEGLARRHPDLEGFLAEHYTASKDTAAAIAAYLKSVDREAGPAHRSHHLRRNAVQPPRRAHGKTPTAKESDQSVDEKSDDVKSSRAGKKAHAERKRRAHKAARKKDARNKNAEKKDAADEDEKSSKKPAHRHKRVKRRHAPKSSEAEREKPKSTADKKTN